jgi:hypothetical protein
MRNGPRRLKQDDSKPAIEMPGRTTLKQSLDVLLEGVMDLGNVFHVQLSSSGSNPMPLKFAL